MRRSAERLPRPAAVLLVAALAVACSEERPATPVTDAGIGDAFVVPPPTLECFSGDLPAIRERGVLRALGVPSRTDFFADDGRIMGIQAEYLAEFEAFLNHGVDDEAARTRVQYVPVPFAELIPALRSGRGDLAAALLTATSARGEQAAFVTGMALEASEVVVRHRRAPPVARIEALAGREVLVLSGSSYQQHLHELNARFADVVVEPAVLRGGTRAGWAVREDAPRLRAALDEFAAAEISDWDRRAFTWAAYNAGPAKVRRARFAIVLIFIPFAARGVPP